MTQMTYSAPTTQSFTLQKKEKILLSIIILNGIIHQEYFIRVGQNMSFLSSRYLECYFIYL